jgi:hypothetical protein
VNNGKVRVNAEFGFGLLTIKIILDADIDSIFAEFSRNEIQVFLVSE